MIKEAACSHFKCFFYVDSNVMAGNIFGDISTKTKNCTKLKT